MNYNDALESVYGTQMFGIKLGLENVIRLLDALEIDLNRAPCVHVAGTNGKGSVCAMIEQITREGKVKTGLFTSPHLVTYRERIRVNGKMIAEDDVAIGLTRIRSVAESLETHPTFFELTFGLAMEYFQSCGVELAIIETGMGGRLDATNVVTPLVSVLTPVSLDHQQWLGEGLAGIAAEKAGIIKPGIPVVSALQSPEVQPVIDAFARSQSSKLLICDQPYVTGKIGLRGSHQAENAALAVAAVREIPFAEFTDDMINRGLENTRWAGRFDIRSRPEGGEVVIDGAHNPAAMNCFVDTWRNEFGQRRGSCIFAVVDSKDVRQVLRLLSPIVEELIFVEMASPRAIPPIELMEMWAEDGPARTAESVESALSQIPGDKLVMITGSLFLSGEALALLGDEGRTFEPSTQ